MNIEESWSPALKTAKMDPSKVNFLNFDFKTDLSNRQMPC